VRKSLSTPAIKVLSLFEKVLLKLIYFRPDAEKTWERSETS